MHKPLVACAYLEDIIETLLVRIHPSQVGVEFGKILNEWFHEQFFPRAYSRPNLGLVESDSLRNDIRTIPLTYDGEGLVYDLCYGGPGRK